MFAKNKKILGCYAYPVTTVLIIWAFVTFFCQGLSDMLVYDRSSILSGELWRLLSGHLVHFSKGHLVLDLLALVVAGLIIESRRYPGFGLMCLFSAVGVGVVSLLFLPDMHRYGGLSAIGISAITFLCLFSIKENEPKRWVYLVILLLTVFKIIHEIATGQMLFASADKTSIIPVPLAHLTGIIVAILFFVLKTRTHKHDCPTSAWSRRHENRGFS
jgi:rhomboid family GlyGly-CTERM serine protease